MLWIKYPNTTVSNFETGYDKATESKLKIFQPDLFGPETQPTTVLNNFKLEADSIVDDRMENLEEMQLKGKPMLDSDFTEGMRTATEQSSYY